ncbi:hypothetical protein VOLCADRAFT_120428 [Volvox carteri f. nagariensis]|uniref:TOG domain-containing protein n=1 Tax=Volvox carteri f. nagariensis TaxID=3068 RepID=D8TL71_VOLCA|nr:uncharacterized protein VOLCADRAFT_120428 [Volvox carteri f. nagariensis]EFJ51820.1 hypothetical protein VOLCADRAFT_120428 [Volvox carteri f. nagariensis]|eukprot:XP_002947230.1 hypothetical protein VOLCADRAFT_120428 [Volvox carteri f. nagariensis]
MALNTPPLAEVLELLGNQKHLQREKGLYNLSVFLKGEGAKQSAVETGLLGLLAQQAWEKKLGGLMGAKVYVDMTQADEPFLEQLRLAAMELLEDSEALARRQGMAIVEACLPQVLESISKNFDRAEDADEEAEGPDGQRLRTAPMVDFVTESPALPGSPVERPSSPFMMAAREETEAETTGELSGPGPAAEMKAQEVMQPAQLEEANGWRQGGELPSQLEGSSDAGCGVSRVGASSGQRDLQVSRSTESSGSGGSLVTMLLQSTYRKVRPGHGEMRHATEGWKCLETSMKALQALVEGCGPAIGPLLDGPLRELLYKALHHPNRFVRETGHLTMCTVCEALRGPRLAAISGQVAERLADGMGDNWSQVRYAACVSTRSLLEWLEEGEEREALMPVLLPPMCLNRYYVAEGVRLYAQETWRRVMGDGGRAAVARHINFVVAHYILQSRANNHAVREAACACIAELMEKVDRAAVSPHVPALFRSLVVCFKDMSWPVRDAACIAAGRAVLAYPEEMRHLAGEMLGLWLAHLADNIPTVRANSAVALAKALRAYGDDVLPALLAALDDMLLRAREQPAESTKYSGLSNETRFGVAARKARDNDRQASDWDGGWQLGRQRPPARGLSFMEACGRAIAGGVGRFYLFMTMWVHSDQEMFSCGSLMARFSTSYLIRSDGCMDHGFSRDKEPWEVSDGAVHLLRELAAVRPQAVADAHLEALVELGSLGTFQHAFNLHETVWRSLKAIGEAIGKPRFKRHLRQLLVPLLADCRCGHQLAEAAAQQCLEALRAWVGPGIFAGHQPRLPHACEGFCNMHREATVYLAMFPTSPMAVAKAQTVQKQLCSISSRLFPSSLPVIRWSCAVAGLLPHVLTFTIDSVATSGKKYGHGSPSLQGLKGLRCVGDSKKRKSTFCDK